MNSLLEREDCWILPLQNRKVLRFTLDYALRLMLGDETLKFELMIEEDFVFKDGDNHYQLSPHHLTAIGAIFSTFNQPIREAIAYKNGKLQIEFTNHSVIEIDPNDQYEAWGIYENRSANEGLQIVCIPGGDLAIWLHPEQA